MVNGIKCETIRTKDGYVGRIAVYDEGKRVGSERTGIDRISRGDALVDARQKAHDILLFNINWRSIGLKS